MRIKFNEKEYNILIDNNNIILDACFIQEFKNLNEIQTFIRLLESQLIIAYSEIVN